MNYLAFLKWLIDVGGAKLPRILAFIQEQMDLFAKYQDIFTLDQEVFTAEPTADELVAEKAAVALCEGSAEGTFGAIGDGSIIALLRRAYTFYQTHKELIDSILKLLK